jgi:hypothetical protein
LAEHPKLTSFPCRKSQEGSEGENCLSIVRFVNEIDMEEVFEDGSRQVENSENSAGDESTGHS